MRTRAGYAGLVVWLARHSPDSDYKSEAISYSSFSTPPLTAK
jgi:hypothetical protein